MYEAACTDCGETTWGMDSQRRYHWWATAQRFNNTFGAEVVAVNPVVEEIAAARRKRDLEMAEAARRRQMEWEAGAPAREAARRRQMEWEAGAPAREAAHRELQARLQAQREARAKYAKEPEWMKDYDEVTA